MSPNSPSPAIAKLEWRGVRKRFGGAPVLDGLDLAVAPGRSLVIIGGIGIRNKNGRYAKPDKFGDSSRSGSGHKEVGSRV